MRIRIGNDVCFSIHVMAMVCLTEMALLCDIRSMVF